MYPLAAARFEPLKALTDSEKTALEFYGSIDKLYIDINEALRTGKMPDSADRAAAVRYTIDNLKSALKKLKPKEAQLVRAVSGDFISALSNLKVGTVVRDDGFGSYTTKGGPTLDQFIRSDSPSAVIRVRAKNAKDVSEAMRYSEGEHILAPGTSLKLVEKVENGHYSRKGGYMPLYIFEEV
jgi:hypothetical protein